MKQYFFALGFSLLGTLAFAQVSETTKATNSSASRSSSSETNVYPINIGPFNIPSFPEYFIAAEVISSDNVKITLSYQNSKDTSVTFTVSPFIESTFSQYFNSRFPQLLDKKQDATAKNLL